jgi:predicted dehydrogenase
MNQNDSYLLIIIGLGSIGKRHAEYFSSPNATMVFIDPSEKVKIWKKEHFIKNCKLYKSINSAKNYIDNINLPKFGIISNWGTQHYDSVVSLEKLGVKNFLIEKPIANSIYKIDELHNLSLKNNVNYICGFGWRYSGLFEKINDIAVNKLGGRPSILNYNGGAFGIVTNGIHYLDLAISLFDSYPKKVISSLRSSNINPRNDKLEFYDGTAVFEFKKNRRLILNASNESSVSPTAEVICPLGKIKVNEDMSLTVYKRNEKEIEQDPRVIRLGKAYKLKNVKYNPNYKNGFKLLATQLFSKIPTHNPERELVATKFIIYSLTASLLNKSISTDSNIPKKYYKKNWMIS